MGGRKITVVQEQQICRFYQDADMSIRELATGFGLRPYSVSRVLIRHGISRRPNGQAAWSRAQYAASKMEST